MAKLPSIKVLSREDLKEAPEWIVKLITPLNSFMQSVYYALDKDITFSENIAAAVKEVKFVTRSDYTTAPVKTDGWDTLQIYNPLDTKPIGVYLIKIVDLTAYKIITEPVMVHWDYLDGYIKLTYITGLKDSNNYQINLMIL